MENGVVEPVRKENLGVRICSLCRSVPWRIVSCEIAALVTPFHTTCLSAGPAQDGPHATWRIISKAIDELHASLESRPGETAMAEDPAGLKVSWGRLEAQHVLPPRVSLHYG